MSKVIKNRIASFRAELINLGLHAFIVPTADPHNSEYLADYWKSREWLSGFTGSQGVLVVTLEHAAIWVDSRYYLQAEEELADTGIEIQKVVLIDYLDIAQWLVGKLENGARVGIDGFLVNPSTVNKIATVLNEKQMELVIDRDPMASIWGDRPSLPLTSPFILDEKYAGESVEQKLSRLRGELIGTGATSILLTALDEIAWLTNLRGKDIECNPVFISYMYVSPSRSVLFIDSIKLTPDVASYLCANGIETLPYESVPSYLSALTSEEVVMIDDNATSCYLIQSLSSAVAVLFRQSPIAMMKAVKNDVEIEGIRRAMIKDGVALTQFMRWLESALGRECVTEVLLEEKLIEIKKRQADYVGESFNTIAGYEENGAIVHYHARKETTKELAEKGLLLLDCGSQYYDGTTDITRTIALGEITDEQRKDYTLVLKGHIALASCRFPKGTRGAQLDVLARRFLWDERMNYFHGTGHGIGHFLNVHEGPQSIRMNENPTLLLPGMILSNEPGLYKAGSHGVRLENQIRVTSCGVGDFGEFYAFENLTLFPYDRRAIDVSLLSKEEKEYVDRYHRMVLEHLSPLLTEDEVEWLTEKCRAIE